MKVALTGASGFIGTAIARHLKESGHEVNGLVRATSRMDLVTPYLDRTIVGDQCDESVWPDLLEGTDCVVHNSMDWAALKAGDLDTHYRSNLLGSVRLIDAAGPRQFVYMSTIAVHHDMRPRWEGVVDEDHPTRPGNLYGACKAAVEAHLWAAHFSRGQSACALRPCAVYGMDPRLDRSIGYPIINRVRDERRFRRLGGGKFVHVDDVAAVTAAAIGNPAAAGAVYNLVDCYARWSDLAHMARDLLSVEADIDDSSPDAPKNRFTKDAVQSLGVSMDRGHEGIRAHLRELIETMDRERAKQV